MVLLPTWSATWLEKALVVVVVVATVLAVDSEITIAVTPMPQSMPWVAAIRPGLGLSADRSITGWGLTKLL